MPTEVFNNLQKEKQNKICEAGYLVFSLKPFEEVSISEISEAMNIKRTAFYYYFNSKEDFYQYLVDEMKKSFLANYIYNKEQKLDFIDIFVLLFDYLSSFKNTIYQGFYEQLFYSVNLSSQAELLKQLVDPGRNNYSHVLDFDCYKMKTKKEINEIIILIFQVIYHELLRYYQTNCSFNDAKESLLSIIEYLKYGIVKDGNKNE